MLPIKLIPGMIGQLNTEERTRNVKKVRTQGQKWVFRAKSLRPAGVVPRQYSNE